MKTLNLARTIGVIRRGGMYYPSNKSSEEKWRAVFDRFSISPQTGIISHTLFAVFVDMAKKCGYAVRVISRGLGR